MKILKASAGSGKTYRLSKEYVRLLLSGRDRDAYRHILAVTFTNKATDEMKERILEDLDSLSREDPRARDMLVSILHDYGAFSVSTIDHFFQRTLKAFSREVGQFADYQIELERKELICEAMDRILDSLTPDDKDLVGWISGSLAGRLERGSDLDMDSVLYEIGVQLKSEQCLHLAESHGIDLTAEYSKERLSALAEACGSICSSFIEELRRAGFEDADKSRKFTLAGNKRKLSKLPEAMKVIDDGLVAYNTAYDIGEKLFGLGFAGEFYSAFDSLLREKNVMCLDESNQLLRDIIGTADAPFIYEKVGVRYDSFLLDEFQDTSNVQWANFLPLLRESEARGGSNLIVGDVKQSIYRFRDSDWSLLDSGVAAAFPDASVETLQGNWRSSRAVVGFNNSFFRMASSKLGLSGIYADVGQKVMRDDTQEGRVEVFFCDEQLEMTYDRLCSALSCGASYGDIAVLVRNRREGAKVANYLLEKGVPVISDDSLNVKSSPAVIRAVSLMKAYDNPEDSICRYISDSLGVSFPGEYHSLFDFCEGLLRSLRDISPESFDGETLFVQAFMDDVKSWTELNGNDIGRYLKHWDESNIAIGSPRNDNSLRVITIHKSKGLQFPYVIFPFAEKVDLYKSGVHWCHLDARANRLPDVMTGIYPVTLGKDKESSFFAGELESERRRQAVDNLNLFYVAFTRAEKTLCVISAPPSKKFRDALAGGKQEYSRLSDLLYEFAGGMDSVSFGEEYDFSGMRRKKDGELVFEASYPSFRLDGRLQPSCDAEDFFSDDFRTGYAASSRLRGIVLHGILSSVVSPESLSGAVGGAFSQGLLDEDQRSGCLEMLSARVAAHPEWFPPDCSGITVLNETTVFDDRGREFRPDRVLVSEGRKARIVDFKFGQKADSHIRQISRYASIYRAMGYDVVQACLWYVESDETVSI